LHPDTLAKGENVENVRGERFFKQGKEVGFITSSTASPKHSTKVALAYVRKEANALGESPNVGTTDGPPAVIIAP
jgi:glycine cleavage system aminomethyltransferase T